MVQEEKHKKIKNKNRESKKKAEVKANKGNEQEKDEAIVPRKSKVVWTTSFQVVM